MGTAEDAVRRRLATQQRTDREDAEAQLTRIPSLYVEINRLAGEIKAILDRMDWSLAGLEEVNTSDTLAEANVREIALWKCAWRDNDTIAIGSDGKIYIDVWYGGDIAGAHSLSSGLHTLAWIGEGHPNYRGFWLLDSLREILAGALARVSG